MALDLRANTAVDVLIGPFVDETDGKTAETGLTISQADVRLSKNGQNMAQKNDNTSCVHDELGYHNCELDATDTNTEGTLVLAVHESGALPVRHEYNIMAEAAWDSLYVAKDTGYMDVNVKAVSEDTTAADNLESACDNYSVTRGLSGTALPAAAADAAGGLMISDDGGWDADELYDAIITDAAGANVAIDIIALKAETALIVADTNELQTDDYPTSIAAIQTTVDAIEVGTITNATGADVATDVKAIKAETVLIVADTNELQTDDYPTSIAAIKAETALIVADTNELQTDNYPTSIAAVQTTVDAIETAVITNAAGVDVAADIIAVKAETATIVADTNELQTDDYPTSIAAIQTTVDAIEVGTVTNATGIDVATDVKAIKAETALIVADTNELQTDNIPGTLATIAGYLDTEIADLPTVAEFEARTLVAADYTVVADLGTVQTEDHTATIAAVKAETALIVADTNELKTDDIPAAIAALNDLSAANVNTEVADVLKTDTLGEPAQGAPPATASIEAKIAWMYKFLRNKATNDGTTIEIYNDAGAVVDHKSTVSEAGGTVTRGEFGTGP